MKKVPDYTTINLHAEQWFDTEEYESGVKTKVALIKESPVYDPIMLASGQVTIDGKVYRVRGVETLMVPRSPKNPYTTAFTLAVY